MVKAINPDVLSPRRSLPYIPVGRLGEPRNRARSRVSHSDDAGFITGSTISANGPPDHDLKSKIVAVGLGLSGNGRFPIPPPAS